MASPTAQPIESVEQLTQRFVDATKAPAARRVGVEHEKVLIEARGERALLAPPHAIIASLLRDLQRDGHADGPAVHDSIDEAGEIIGLKLAAGGTVTLEPGGQLEHSSAPRATLGEALADNDRHLDQLLTVAAAHDLIPLAIGFRPFGSRDDVPWMPKGRYAVMRRYLPTRGQRGLDMMKRTTTVQANFDWTSEADAMESLRCAFAIGPIVQALFAASPLSDGKPSGYQSTRAATWLDTDPDRCGLLPFVFEEGAGFADYVRWALDVPMFFLKRDDRYHPLHVPFGRFWAEGWQGHHATLDDWELHLSTLFPNVRLRSYVEVRHADASTRELARALPALWLGVLYDDAAREAAWQLVHALSWSERIELELETPRLGLRTPIGRHTLLDLGRELVAIAEAGLSRVQPECLPELEPLRVIAATGRSRADEILELHRVHGSTAALAQALRLT